MGIDIYMRWELITEEQKEAQLCGFDVTKGATGYLREAYHGEPYATQVLLPETFNVGGAPVHIPAATLRERLPETIATAIRREREVYKGDDVNEESPCVQSFVAFVELAERLEAGGHHPMISNCH